MERVEKRDRLERPGEEMAALGRMGQQREKETSERKG